MTDSETIFDLEGLKAELESAEVFEKDGDHYRSVYLGSVMSLTPSGKFYMPWATGNLEACPRCGGSGIVCSDGGDVTCDTCGGCGSEEAYQDELWYERVGEEFSSIGAYLDCGEGDPTDLFISMVVDPADLDEEGGSDE